MARVATGIPGLDELTQGGFLEGSNILVSGGAGTGKTILGTQYIYNGAAEHGEPGIYITIEEGATNLWWNMKSFKWNLTKYEQEDLIKIYRIGMINPEEFATRFDEEVERITDLVEKMGAKRIVIDSTTAFAMWMKDDSQIRYSLFKLADALKGLKVTSIMTAETLGKRDQFSRFGVEEFVADGVVSLYFMPPQRAMFIRKMRGTKHNQKVHPFEIGENGVSINAREEVLWESLDR